MKYFKKELWRAINDDSIPFTKADKEWKRNLTAYWRQLRKLTPRLSHSASLFFNKISLHDGRLLRFEACERLDFTHESVSLDVQPNVRVIAVNDAQTHIYVLQYHKVERVVFDFPSNKPLFYVKGSTIGDWGYDELTSARAKLFRHEILFSSGAAILIESPRITVQVKRVLNKKSK